MGQALGGVNGERMRRSGSRLVAWGIAFWLFLALGFAAGTAGAQGGVRRPLAPTLSGTQGLFHTVAAQVLPDGSLTFGLHGEFFLADGFVSPNTQTQRMIADLAMSWAPYSFSLLDQDFFTEAALRWRASAVSFDLGTASLTPPPPELIQVSSLDWYFKLARTQVLEDEMEPYNYALGLGIFIPSKVDSIGISAGQTSVSIDGLFTYDLAAQNEDLPPARFHANVGYFLNNTSATEGFFGCGPSPTPQCETSNEILRFAAGQSLYNQIRLRLGAEYAHRRFTPFLEWGMDGLLKFPAGIGFLDSPQWITPGIRIRPTPEINLSLGVDIAVVQAADPTVSVLPDWNLIFGFSYTNIPTPPPPPPPLIEPKERAVALATTGKITGVVYDANTNLPLGNSTISFPGRDLNALLTDPNSGVYTTYDLPAGPVEIKASRQGYIGRSATPTVIAGQTVTQDFYLVPEVVEAEKGTFRGTVQSVDGEFLAGKVTIESTQESRDTDKGVGQFLFELAAGDFRATAESEGYFPESFDFKLEGGQILIHDFVLKKKPVIEKKRYVEIKENRILINQMIYFATGKARILEQSFPVLREIAQVLQENPDIKLLEIQGHTDSRGSDKVNKKLSQGRAESVRDFIIKEGVDKRRLTAVGYGEEVPLVFPDDTKEKQARNRRVEFIILKQGD